MCIKHKLSGNFLGVAKIIQLELRSTFCNNLANVLKSLQVAVRDRKMCVTCMLQLALIVLSNVTRQISRRLTSFQSRN